MNSTSKLDIDQFFANNWRRRSLLIRSAYEPEMIFPLISTDALLELANDELAESRVIERQGDSLALHSGPFEELGKLPPDCMLMVNGVEQFNEAISNFLSSFPLLPRWRVDDLMISLGGQNASCGAHFDHYDVFLIQLRESKTWFLDAGSHTDEDLMQDSPIRLLSSFTATEELNVTPGDMLYIPPGVGHHGINQGEQCLTLSIGIRNPAITELISHYADDLCDHLSANELLNDPIQPEINDVSRTFLSAQLEKAWNHRAQQLPHWYACYMSEPRTPELFNTVAISSQQVASALATGTTLRCHPATRIAPLNLDGHLSWYINGEVELAELDNPGWMQELEDNRYLKMDAGVLLSQTDMNKLTQLVEIGALELVGSSDNLGL